ncbi:MAG TPA: branched-chain amino acid ABC transporter substrate-binding protein [Acidobacteriota bacterium]|nr:branched-chain amino acid ABC transporter substrate-binding protein [Acidobacteriota bacterium]HNT16743.1 branched-chain amino acid ABC transporter substrate-binding protein [Acidobacteriota bacterium]
MFRKYALVSVALLVIGAAFMLTGCLGSKTVTIAVAMPLTGEDAEEGKSIVNAVQLAVDEVNAKGGLFGKPVQLVTKDDHGSTETAAKVAGELCDDKVAAVIGHYTSSCTLAARDIYFTRKIIMMTPSSTNPAVTDGIYPTIFRVCGRDDKQGEAAAEHVAAAWPDAKVALIHDNSSYGKDLADKFLSIFSAKTKKESVLYTHFDRSVVDFEPVVKELKEKEPTVIYFGGLFLQGAELLKAIRSAGINALFVSGDGCWNEEFIKRAGALSEGCLATFNPQPEGTSEGKAFAREYKAKFGDDPHPYSLFAYTAAKIIIAAIQKAGSKDPIAVAQVIRSQQFDTPFGPMSFDQKGDPSESPWTVWQVENGKFVTAPKPVPPPAAETPPEK